MRLLIVLLLSAAAWGQDTKQFTKENIRLIVVGFDPLNVSYIASYQSRDATRGTMIFVQTDDPQVESFRITVLHATGSLRQVVERLRSPSVPWTAAFFVLPTVNILKVLIEEMRPTRQILFNDF